MVIIMGNVETLIQRQLDAYNAKDLDGWLATYAIDATQYLIDGEILASGHVEMRKNIEIRFQEPDLNATLINRIVFDNIVVDHELITRNFPEGKGTLEMLCVYHVENDLIQKAQFKISHKKLS